MVGGFAFTRDGAMVLCDEDGVYILKDGGLKQIYDIPALPGEMFNDITTDPKGRIFAGTVRRPGGEGCLYRLERGKPPVKVIEDTLFSNGMTFSLDCKTFFHTNSGRRQVTAYDYDIRTGDISNPRIFFQGTEEQGFPDGLTLDSEDHIWQAFWGAGLVRRLSPSGKIVYEIQIPARQPSSVMFGGEKLNHLYITTACEGGTDLNTGMDEKKGIFLGGKVYRCIMNVHGREEWFADFR